MTIAIAILSTIIWFIIGYKSFVYWWTKDNDYVTSDIPVALIMGIFGPITFIAGWFIHGDPIFTSDRLIKRKRV